jgi:hypothetical protein
MLDPVTLARVEDQLVGTSATVPMTSSDSTVGAITVPTLTFARGEGSKSSAFDPATSGTAIVSFGSIAGFDTPTNQQQILFNVTPGSRTLTFSPNAVTTSPSGSVLLGLILSEPAGPGGLRVDLIVDDTVVAEVSPDVIIPEGETSVLIGIASRAQGQTTIRALATGIPEATAQIKVPRRPT